MLLLIRPCPARGKGQAVGGRRMEMETEVRRDLSMILIRVMVGMVFLLEGILKFLRPEELGAGRFEALGLPFPHILAPLAGGIEIVGGAAILLNIYAGDGAFALRSEEH